MRIIHRFGKTDLQPSAIGLGCAALMSRIGPSRSLACLHDAFDSEINYFDVARGYGYGEAEAVVGEFVRDRRDQVIIATKVGRLPATLSWPKRLVVNYARPLLRFASRRQRRKMPEIDVRSPKSGGQLPASFQPAAMRASLETSLRALQTDYVDVLLLHDPPKEAIEQDGLAEFMDEVLQEGKARYVGITGSSSFVADAVEVGPARFAVAQFENSLVRPQLQTFLLRDSMATLTHSPFARGQRVVLAVAEFLAQKPAVKEVVADRLGSAGGDLTTMAGALLLHHALAENASGVVLCGMYRREQIAANAQVARLSSKPWLDRQTVEELRDWLQAR